MRDFWHLTSPAALPAILREGLRPMVGERCLQGCHLVGPAIFLAGNRADAELLASSWYWHQMHLLGTWLLRVRTDEEPRERDHRASNVGTGDMWIMRQLVPPERVRVACYLTVTAPADGGYYGEVQRHAHPPHVRLLGAAS